MCPSAISLASSSTFSQRWGHSKAKLMSLYCLHLLLKSVFSFNLRFVDGSPRVLRRMTALPKRSAVPRIPIDVAGFSQRLSVAYIDASLVYVIGSESIKALRTHFSSVPYWNAIVLLFESFKIFSGITIFFAFFILSALI